MGPCDAPCYNLSMSLKDDIQAYHHRWEDVNRFQAEERRSASIELRWRQLNAAYGMAKALGLLRRDPSELGVFEKWAKLKEKAESHQKNT